MKVRLLSLAFVLSVVLTAVSHAELIDRGGGLIYDTELNVTWLQDANYAYTSGYASGIGSPDGLMSWDQATTWAANLSYYDSARNVTWTDWRLPNTLPLNGFVYNHTQQYDGSTDAGHNISAIGTFYEKSKASEMAYMFYNSLNNVSMFFTNGTPNPNWSISQNSGPFENLQRSSFYWSDTEVFPGQEFFFYFGAGNQGYWSAPSFAWAVRDGDVGPPTLCAFDYEPDGDVDGSDLAALISFGELDIQQFAGDFGRVGCP